VVTLRASTAGDEPVLIAGRDAEFHRFLGPAVDAPRPAACIVVGGTVVGWADHDHDPEHDWLAEDEVNLGYFVFAGHRGRGYATSALSVLTAQLAEDTAWRTASLLIRSDNEPSLAVARRSGFEEIGPRGDSIYWRRPLRRGE
jgi:RimJ/RimL family protein N-acetyltransferase